MINEATVQRTRFFPELLPDARVVSAGAGSEVSPPILDLRRFDPRVLYLSGLSVEQTANAEVRIRADNRQLKVSCAGFPNRKPVPVQFTSTEALKYNLYGVAAVSDFRTTYGVWVMRPTIAHKIALGKQLTQAEEQQAQALGIKQMVDSGVLPLPFDYMIQREHQVVDETIHVLAGDLAPGNYSTLTVSPARGEFLVLCGMSAAPGNASDGIKIRVDRDIDVDYLELDAYAMSLDEEILCWVPALYEIRLKVTASAPVAGHITTIRVKHCLINDIVRIRFGIAVRAGTPQSVIDQVRGGIL